MLLRGHSFIITRVDSLIWYSKWKAYMENIRSYLVAPADFIEWLCVLCIHLCLASNLKLIKTRLEHCHCWCLVHVLWSAFLNQEYSALTFMFINKHSTIELFLIDNTHHLRGNKYFNLCWTDQKIITIMRNE